MADHQSECYAFAPTFSSHVSLSLSTITSFAEGSPTLRVGSSGRLKAAADVGALQRIAALVEISLVHGLKCFHSLTYLLTGAAAV